MRAVADKYTSQLERIKSNIRNSYQYSKDNFDRFHESRKRLFSTAINQDQETILEDQGKPIIEFNMTLPYVMRELGEFEKHVPGIEVSAANGRKIDEKTIQLVDGYIRYIGYEANKNSYAWEVYKNVLSGGYTVVKVYPDWESQMSFTKVIRKEQVFDPTL